MIGIECRSKKTQHSNKYHVGEDKSARRRNGGEVWDYFQRNRKYRIMIRMIAKRRKRGCRSDFDIVLIQIDQELKEHTEACHIEMGKVVNVSYNPKYYQLCLEYEKGYGQFGELLNLGDTSRKTMYGPKNIQQTEEREKFLDFAEAFRGTLEQKGYKLDKWKR